MPLSVRRGVGGEVTGKEKKSVKPKSSLSSGVVNLQRVGKYKLRQARDLRQEMTPSEKKLWELVRRKQILGLKFRRQQVIDGFVADFYCHQAKLVIELDGGIHDIPEQQKRDDHRRNVFALRGLEEIRFKNKDIVENTDEVLRQINEKIKKRL